MKIVLVDDKKSTLLILKKMIGEIAGAEVVGSFQDAESAFAFMASNDADIAFLDIRMPGASGLELAKRMETIRSDISVVFLTSHKEYALEAFDVHACDYLVKPVSQERLERSVRRAMEMRDVHSVIAARQAAPLLSVYGFGGFDARSCDGDVIRWPTAKCAEVFAFLLLNRGRSVPRDVILDEVFAGNAAKNTEMYLHTIVYKIRKTLEPHGMKDALFSQGGGYGLLMKEIYVDFFEFDDAVRSLPVVDESRLAKAERLENLYSGELFGNRDYFWATFERERLSDAYARLSVLLGHFLLESGNVSGASAVVKKLLMHNDLEETPNALLLKVYAKQQDKASLESHYNNYVRHLWQELGVGPGVSLIRLYEELKSSLDDIP